MAAAAGIAGWLTLEPNGPTSYGTGTAGALAVLVLGAGLAVRWPSAIPPALVLLGGSYGLFLTVEEVSLDLRAAAVAGVLLLVAELGYWSLELRGEVTDEPGSYARRVALLAVLGLGGMALAAGLLTVVDLAGRGGLGVEIAGALAALAAVLLLLGLARRA